MDEEKVEGGDAESAESTEAPAEGGIPEVSA